MGKEERRVRTDLALYYLGAFGVLMTLEVLWEEPLAGNLRQKSGRLGRRPHPLF